MEIERLLALKLWVNRTDPHDDEEEEEYQQDLVDILNKEIHRIESRIKVPLVPCKCGGKRISGWISQQFGYVYRCNKCSAGFEYRSTDREARLAWNEKMGKVE